MSRSSHAANKEYLRRLVEPMLQVPKVAAIELAVEIFIMAVEKTNVDSGQAALNWRIQPFNGSPSYEAQTMMWGYGNVNPTPPAGYKWSGGDSAGAIQQNLINEAIVLSWQLRGQKFDGISVYNPITPGFPGFAPGNDDRYEYFALSDAEAALASGIGKAIKTMEQRVAAEFPFVRAT